MSILIKGMSKPTDCGLCPFEDFGYCAVKGERNTSEKGIDDDCPLVEIKDMTNEEFDSILARLIADRKDEPQKDRLKQFKVGLKYHKDTTHFGKAKGESVATNKIKDEPQTEVHYSDHTDYQGANDYVTQTDCAWQKAEE